MESYELTDRGKIVITVVIVVLLLFLPAAILLYTAMTGQPSQPSDDLASQASVAPPTPLPEQTPQPPITESPPPNGGGFNPTDVSPPENVQSPPRSPDPEESALNPIEGTLSFLFSPNLHSAMSANVSLLLDEFLTSPKNKPGSIIAVETPQLSLETSEKLISIIGSALSIRGIPQNRIEYIENQTVPEGSFFEVSMSYINRPPK